MTPPATEVTKVEKKGLFEEIWISVFNPGVNDTVVKAMNLSFVASLFSLGFLSYSTGGNIHTIIVFVTTACLFVAINFFVKELQKVEVAPSTESKKED
ncbi:hypothetical protein K493DRAFT_270945 [Basidiobolus meristosporus CBS 931.73]|uniref:Uncharacterized protein n=1 Tax=Basidiobolus meristosporus CBS 931.73 TaxID=1314790 RepID=A0A1Y1X450_9FUNG|nr:hypothetical protein K493DRAFT_270945 [Basidiobolus meristosporus CBS 931.73]|eukprot:ORX80094.1 hypothetical protein K493DRAFT_270945 [Basidiobolus meristosporus CBS 931.73]